MSRQEGSRGNTGESGIYASAQAASFLHDDLSDLSFEHQELIDEFVTYINDPKAVKILTRYTIAADRRDKDAMQWGPVRDVVRTAANQGVTEDLNEANAPRLQALVGLVDNSTSATGGGSDPLTQFVTREGYSLYLIGGTGDGKNNCAFKMAERFKDSGIEGGHIISNTYSLEGQDYYVDSLARLRKVGRDTDGWGLAILDECSNWGTGHASDAFLAEKAGKVQKFARKDRYKLNLIFIGHDGKDLHPSIRKTVDHVARMEPRNYGQGDTRPGKMVVGRDIDDRKIKDEIDLSPISGITETFFSYDDGESSSFYLQEDREDRIRARLEHPDISYTQEQIAEAEGISRSRVSQIVSDVNA